MGTVLRPERREFEMTDADFERIRHLLKSRSGIDVGEGKRMLVYGRLTRRLRALNLRTFNDYLALVQDASAPEARSFLNSLTTNVTELFREEHHFELIKDKLVPEVERLGTRRLRIWSAGCSVGDEPYSIALTLATMPQLDGWDIKILATDIDSDVLAQGREGIYQSERIEKLRPNMRALFSRGIGSKAGLARAGTALRSMITFKQLNLLDEWPMSGPFDMIFCRNVIIYFDVPTKERLVERYTSLLRPGGYLLLGHSESPAAGNLSLLEPAGRTAFRKRLG